MAKSKCREVEKLLESAYPAFSFSCTLQADGQYQIRFGRQSAVAPLLAVGIAADELRTAKQIRELGQELINCFVESTRPWIDS